jgi:large subunit ribosomal protein L21
MTENKEKYAVIETGGQQYAVREGDVHKIAKLEGDAGSKVEFDQVLFINDGGKVKIGKPTVKNAKVTGEIVEQALDTKIRIFKYKRRKKFRRTTGHREQITYIKITGIA